MRAPPALSCAIALALAFGATAALPAANWDSGFKSSSAIGQLQELTGQRISVPRSSGGLRPSGGGMANNAMSSATNTLANAVFTELLNLAFSSDNGQSQAMAAEMRRRAEWERQIEAERRQEQLRARFEAATRSRADWDRRDAEITSALDGVFEVRRSTDFFGIQSNADPALVRAVLTEPLDQPPANGPVGLDDPSIVDLRGSGAVPSFLRAPETFEPSPRARLAEPPAQPARPMRERIVAEYERRLAEVEFKNEYAREGAGWAVEFWRDQMKDLAEAGGVQFFEKLPGLSKFDRVWSIYGKLEGYDAAARPWKERVEQYLNTWFYNTQGAAAALGSRSGAEAEWLERADRQLGEEAEAFKALARDTMRGEITGNVFKPDYSSLFGSVPDGTSLVRPIEDKVIHPDAFRWDQVSRPR
jgi:hypothetical protein